MRNLADLFDVLAEQTNLRILFLLHEAKQELCVCELVDSLGEKQYNVSKHLRELLKAGLITCRKEERWVYYRLEKKNRLLQDALNLIRRHLQKQTVITDKQRLRQRLSLRQEGKCLLGVLGRRL